MISISLAGVSKLVSYLKTFMQQQDKQLYDTAMIIAKEVEQLLLQPTTTWEHKPEVRTEVKKYAFGYKVDVIIDDKPYFWVNFGTKPHYIRATKGVLRFNFSVPKTIPNSLNANFVNKQMGNYIYAKYVYHPGITPRRFDIIARQKLNQKLPGIINNKMHRFWQKFFRGIF